MYGFKTATVKTAELTLVVDLQLNGDWVARNSDDHNELCVIKGLDRALSRALESDDAVGVSKDGLVTVEVSK